MKKDLSQRLKLSGILSVIVLSLGLILLTFMIITEDEPGALPLLLVLTGTIWLLISRYQKRKFLFNHQNQKP